MNARQIKTLIVDDEPIARRVLREDLALWPEIAIVGEAENGRDALLKIAKFKPDLVFLDLQMPIMSGFEVVRSLTEPPLPVVVIVTAFDQHAIQAFEAGAIDYLLKPVSEARLGKAIERAKNLLSRPDEVADQVAQVASVSTPSNPVKSQRVVARNGPDYLILDPMTRLLALAFFAFCFATAIRPVFGQSNGTIRGSVTDPSGAAIPGAVISIQNPISHYSQETKTDSQGNFVFTNVPYNPYHVTASAERFAAAAQDVDLRSPIPVQLPKFTLQVGATATTVTVEAAGDLLENDPTPHTDIDRGLFDKLPLESASSSLSSLVTLSAAGIAADSNGLFHGLGDHASNSFSVDGQPITDQQSKVFSNQVPVDAIQSVEVIQGAPPAEFGGKTSLVIDVTTRSGQGMTTPHGGVNAYYGTFGTSGGGFNLGNGGEKWGNFISANVLNTGRFLDPPEFTVLHDKGNEENIFDRLDFQASSADSLHLNLNFSRSWFQNPNTYD